MWTNQEIIEYLSKKFDKLFEEIETLRKEIKQLKDEQRRDNTED